ncbi:DNA mismatch repair protein Mlh3 isoform X2 [Neopsephotus bourkii]|uniref:DNA mismatch repair protein Mlh3 isoform X2 n=1 Tax=Neopsephotus bourkii TaxID=309878 RepID=UPI002AA50D49|nr:DNA mismatch repair protein Mlh3 isoform X2 [Neopsephotus bourkii]
MIKRLVEDVRAKLRSGTTISSLGQCVEELVLNSIDAKATCVAVRVDLEGFKVQVVDNGSGMGREDLNAMGKRYFTSKCKSVGDLEKLTSYGFRGEAVASIANVASIVEISSKSSRTAKTFVKLFHNGQALEVCEAELSRPSGGTTVTVCNLFHQLPVRRKCMDPVLEFERVRQKVEAISLMHPSISLSLRNDVSCSMVLQLPKTRDVYSRFCQIYGLGRSQKLREINHKSGGFEINGYISTEGHYNKNMQFLYVNRRLVLKTRLHKLIDFLLRKESVICKAKSAPVSRQASPSCHRCGPELYGIFVLNVTCAYSDYDVCLEPAKTLIEFQNWDVVLTCIEEGVKIFLKREHLFIEPCSEDIREFNEDNDFSLCNAPVLKPSLPDEKSIQDSFKKACDEILDSYEMCNLQSKDVKRKSVTRQKSSSLIESNKNLQETEIAPHQKIDEPSDPCRNNRAEIPLPSKDDTASGFLISDISEQEPKDTISSQKVPDAHLKPSGNLCSSFSEGARSEIRKIDSCDDLQHCAENYIKDMGSQQGKVVQKSNKVCTLNNDVSQLSSERGDSTEAAVGSEIVSGNSLMRLCNAKREDGETADLTDDAGRQAVSSIPLKLCSTGLITCVTQKEAPHECEQTEISLALNMQRRPGPVSAKDAFGHNVNLRSLNSKDVSSSTNKEYTPPYTRDVCIADGSEWLQNNTLSKKVNKEASLPTASSRMHCETSDISELPLATSSGIPQNKVIKSNRRQTAVPRPQPSVKLSLSSQLGSLEKFRRYYGRDKCTLPTPSQQSEFDLTVFNSQANCDFSRNDNDHHGNLSTCETPAVEDTDSDTSSEVVSLGYTLFCSGATSEDRQALCQSPLTLSGYCKVSNDHASCKRSPGSLSSKLSRMKGDHKELEQLSEQFPRDSSRKDDYSFVPGPSNNDFSYNACKTYKSSVERMGDCNYGVSKGDACWPLDGTILEPVKSTVSASPLSSIEEEYTVSSSSVLSLPAKKDCSDDICKDKSMLDRPSEQNLKDTEAPHTTFLSNLQFSAYNTSTGDPRNGACCSDWLQDFDVSLGKTIYINKTTGLSTYNTPPVAGFQAACIQDITTMAVNVVSESGFQFRCHPFRSETVLPFLPRPQKEKTLASQDLRDTEGESLQSLLSEWDNPVFVPCPEIAIDVTSSQADNLAVKIHNILHPYRFTKDMVHSMQVLQQVDNKFIACLINTRNEMDKEADGNLLILVDQHAAHERIRLEQLIADSYEKEAAACGKKKLLSSSISPPLEIKVTEEQRRVLRCCYRNLEDLGLELSFPETNRSSILVRKVPLCFIEREANELRRKRQPVTKSIVELVQSTGGRTQGILPLTFLKVLASQACHGAIKFNEHLTLEESCRLIEALSSCQLPFQCAHGRPSMMPLADTEHLQQDKQPKPNLARLRKMARAWHLFGKKRA